MGLVHSVRVYLDKHPRIDLLQYVFRKKLGSSEKAKAFLSLEKDPLTIQFHHYGEENKGKTLYVISIDEGWKKSGYCHLLRMTLLHAFFAEQMHFQPVSL